MGIPMNPFAQKAAFDDAAPESGPPVCRMASPSELKALGLPFRCEGGRILQDVSLATQEDAREDREPRFVYYRIEDRFEGVQYSRPVDAAIGQQFDAWPDESERLMVTYYDGDELDRLQVKREFPAPTH